LIGMIIFGWRATRTRKTIVCEHEDREENITAAFLGRVPQV
jgi:hypothetical protein